MLNRLKMFYSHNYTYTVLFECPVIYVCRFAYSHIDFMSIVMFTIERMSVCLLFDRLMNFHATHKRTSTMIDVIGITVRPLFMWNVKRLGLWIFCSRCHCISFTLHFVIHFLCFTLLLFHCQIHHHHSTIPLPVFFMMCSHILVFVSMKLYAELAYFFISPANRPTDRLNPNKVGCMHCNLMKSVKKWKSSESKNCKKFRMKRDLKNENSHRCHWQSFILSLYMYSIRINRMICTQSQRMGGDKFEAIFRTIQNGEWQQDVKLIPHHQQQTNWNKPAIGRILWHTSKCLCILLLCKMIAAHQVHRRHRQTKWIEKKKKILNGRQVGSRITACLQTIYIVESTQV